MRQDMSGRPPDVGPKAWRRGSPDRVPARSASSRSSYRRVKLGGSDGARWTQIRYVTEVYGLRRTSTRSRVLGTVIRRGRRTRLPASTTQGRYSVRPRKPAQGRSGGFCSGCGKASHALDVPILPSTYVFIIMVEPHADAPWAWLILA